jgi:hypothetical protein
MLLSTYVDMEQCRSHQHHCVFVKIRWKDAQSTQKMKNGHNWSLVTRIETGSRAPVVQLWYL